MSERTLEGLIHSQHQSQDVNPGTPTPELTALATDPEFCPLEPTPGHRPLPTGWAGPNFVKSILLPGTICTTPLN